MPTTTAFHIQDPSGAGLTMLDAVAEAADGAVRGGGVFAFASRKGVDALLGDPAIETLTSEGEFDLVVGIDAITDVRAIDALASWSGRRSGLACRVLVHGLPILFHPKFCWFVHDERLALLAGSGNLTPGGLVGNLEAFAVTSHEGKAATATEVGIRAWLERWSPKLLALDDPEVQRRAKDNSGAERSLRKRMPPEEEEEEPPTVPVDPGNEADALVLEIPRNAPGRAQLDVGIKYFREFFGAKPGIVKRIRIQHVDADGSLGDIEPPRSLIWTKSRNFRFEAAAGHGKDYPEEGRVLAAFVRMPDGLFRYRLLWPGSAGHAELDALLTRLAGPAGRLMRRERMTLSELRAAWPDSPLLAEAAPSA